VPRDRWHLERFWHPDSGQPGKTYARYGGFLDQSPYEFDARFFGLSAREAAVLDPQQRLLLEATWEAFEDAGRDCTALAGQRVGVFVGGFSLDNLLERLGTISRDHISSSTATSSTMVMLSNRLSHAFDFRGPSLSVDTACSSSLVATHLACQSIARGESHFAIAGGVNSILVPEPFIAMSKGGFLSRRGRCQAFDAEADGYVRAEGVGVVVLRPLSAAIADGDRIYAVILATGSNQDGHTPGISMPNEESQKSLIAEVLRRAELTGRDIAYVEAHGTGTPAGDPIEARSLGSLFGDGRPEEERLLVGSIKTNIGHTEAAAGVAGLIKAALVVSNRKVPPNLHFRTPNPEIDLPSLGLRVPTEPTPLPSKGTLYAAVNSFGYGGTNAHAILASPPERLLAELPEAEEPIDRLYPISARDEAALVDFARSLASHLDTAPLRDIAHSLTRRRTHHPIRAAIWARGSDDLIAALSDLEAARETGRAVLGRAKEQPRRLLFVYTGMGAQYVGMGRELYAKEPAFREAIDRCDAVLRRWTDRPLAAVFAGGASEAGYGRPIGAPQDAQILNFAMQVALTELWRSLGVIPAGTLGHSVGEIGAAWAAGALELEEALRITHHRGEAFQAIAGLGSMMAVGVGAKTGTELLARKGGALSVAAVLSPDSVVVAGPGDELDRLAQDLAADGVFHRRLHVDVAYHHSQVDLIEAALRSRFGDVPHAAPRLPVYSTLLGERIETARHDADYWINGSRALANFQAAVSAALADGFDAVLEIGPNRVMAAAVRSCAAAAKLDVSTHASVVRGEPEQAQLRRTMAGLYVDGVPLNWDAMHPPGRFTPLPRYPWRRERHWIEAPQASLNRKLAEDELLLHQRLDGPSPAWCTDLTAAPLFFLADHVVAGTVLLPAAVHVSALLAASRRLGRGNSLRNLRLHRALAIGASAELRIEIEEASGVGSVSARTGLDADWQRYATARLGPELAPRGASKETLDAAIPAEAPRVDSAAFYAMLDRRGLAYGPAFQVVREACAIGDRVVAELTLPEELTCEDPLHPVLLDGAFQALALLGTQSGGEDPFVPVELAEVRLHAPVGSRARTIARITERSPNSFSATLTICDTSNRILAEIDGLRCQRLPTAERDRFARAKFLDEWDPAPISRPDRSGTGLWIVIGQCVLASRVVKEIRAEGREAVPIAALGEADPGLLENAAGVAWLSPEEVKDGDPGLRATTDLLETLQRLGSIRAAAPRFAVVTRGATGATPRPADVALWGLARVAATEFPVLNVCLIDCAGDDARLTTWLARELLAPVSEREVRLDEKGRQVARLRTWTPPDPIARSVDVSEVPVTLIQRRAGNLDSLAWREIPRSEPKSGQIEIRAQAAALNFKDVLKTMNLLSGAYLERTFFGDTLGMETAGIVTRVGPDVAEFAPGDEVVVQSAHFSSFLVVDKDLARHRPAALSPVEAPVYINYITALHGLVDVARLQRGERVLIHLASGGVGQAAIAIAKMIGAEIFATAGDETKRSFLRQQGVSHVFDSRSLDFADHILELTDGDGVDVVLNSLPGEAMLRSWEVLAPYGRFVEIGKRDIEENALLPMAHFDGNRTFAAIDVDRMLRERRSLFTRILSDVDQLFASGKIGPLPTTAFPASQIADAFRLMSRAKHVGKVVIDFREQVVSAQPLPAPRFRPDRTYVITGAFGGFGQALARWMAREGARRLVLLSRRGPTSPEALALLQELEAAGVQVSAPALDCSDAEGVEALFARIRSDGPAIGGIFHAAMVLDDGLLPTLTSHRLAAVMAPKAGGAWVLHHASRDDPLDHFVLFSSIAAVIGNLGQGAYCAANAALDALARHRRALGQPALSVAWGVLSNAGVAARTDGLVDQLEQLGLRPFTTDDALSALGELMDGGAPACIAFADVDWARWANHAELARSPRFSEMAGVASGSDRLARFRREMSAIPGPERLGALEARLTRALAAVLGEKPESIPLDRSLESLGVDSLMAVELSLSLEQEMGVRLPTSLLMQGPTVKVLAQHIIDEAFGLDGLDEQDIDQLSEEEADALLAMLAQSGEIDLAAIQL